MTIEPYFYPYLLMFVHSIINLNYKFDFRWIPDTGGANIPAINELLQDFAIELGDTVLEGYFSMVDHRMYYASGVNIIQFPETNNSIIVERELLDQGSEILLTKQNQNRQKRTYPILGLLQTDATVAKIETLTPNPQKSTPINALNQGEIGAGDEIRVNNRNLLNNEFDDYEEDKNEIDNSKIKTKVLEPRSKSGRIAVYGDSNCLDSTHLDKACFWLLDTILEYTMTSHITSLLKNMNRSGKIKFNTGKCYIFFITAN